MYENNMTLITKKSFTLPIIESAFILLIISITSVSYTHLDVYKRQQHYLQEGEAFLSRILTCDETWVRHFEPESKRQSMEWKHISSPVKNKFRIQTSAGKVMLTVFWDSEGPVFCDYLEDQRTINSVYYLSLIHI